MSIKDLLQKIKGRGSQNSLNLPSLSDNLFLGFILILVAFGAFGLGRLSKIEDSRVPIRIENAVEFPTTSTVIGKTGGETTQVASVIASFPSSESSQFVGSKSGTKYHFPWCSGAKTISEANKIYFTSKEDAEARGYAPASNCKGL